MTGCLICAQNGEFEQGLAIDRMKDISPETFALPATPIINSRSTTPAIFTPVINSISATPLINAAVNTTTERTPDATLLKRKRVSHFRNAKKPMRYRHSIGSPSLRYDAIDTSPERSEKFGNQEVERFFELNHDFDPEIDTEIDNSSNHVKVPESIPDIKDMLVSYNTNLPSPDKKIIIVQREERIFWSVLFVFLVVCFHIVCHLKVKG